MSEQGGGVGTEGGAEDRGDLGRRVRAKPANDGGAGRVRREGRYELATAPSFVRVRLMGAFSTVKVFSDQ